MKIAALVTHTNDCENKWRSLVAIGHDVTVIQYDDRPVDHQDGILLQVKTLAPDATVYLGAIEKYHGRPVLTIDNLLKLRDIAPTIHICGDASDEPWWEWLDRYEHAACFDAQVSIDGNPRTPIAGFRNGLVRLTPIDPRPFAQQLAWNNRERKSAFVGGKGHSERAELIDYLVGHGSADWLAGGSYNEMAAAMGSRRILINSPMNGSGTGDHVKGRVIEAGFARACLLERKNDQTERWFVPGVDYVEYTDREDCLAKITWLQGHDAKALMIADRLQVRVMQDHHPAVFWTDVFKLAGVKQKDAAHAG